MKLVANQTLFFLEEMLLMYRHDVKVLDEEMERGTSCKPLSPSDIKQLIKSLFDMKLMGKQLSEAMKVADSCNHMNHEYGETIFRPVLCSQKEGVHKLCCQNEESCS